MPNGNRRPWYRNPRWWAAIAAFLAVVVGIVAIILSPRPPSDFNMSVDPLTGHTYPAGTPYTLVTIEDVGGYKYAVTLSAEEPSPGIVVTFTPKGGPIPPFSSTMTMTVNSNVPEGSYTIMIKGLGGDGKEHTNKYVLSVVLPVKPTPAPKPTPTPTPKPTPTPTPTPTVTPEACLVTISEPADGAEVPIETTVRGTASKMCQRGPSLWVVVEYGGSWWPQQSPLSLVALSGTERLGWFVTAVIGQQGDAGRGFGILVISTTPGIDQEFADWFRRGPTVGHPGFPVPELRSKGAKPIVGIGVERK